MESGPYSVHCPLYANERWVLKSSGSLKEARVKVEEEPKKVTNSAMKLWKPTWSYKEDKSVVRYSRVHLKLKVNN